MRVRKLVLAVSLLFGGGVLGATSSSAAPLSGGAGVFSPTDLLLGSLITQVQGRRGRGAGRRGAQRGGARRGGRGGGRRGGIGAGGAAALGIIGAVGTMMAIDAARQHEEGGDAVEYCMRRFNSYDPETGYYLGFDGRHHRCP